MTPEELHPILLRYFSYLIDRIDDFYRALSKADTKYPDRRGLEDAVCRFRVLAVDAIDFYKPGAIERYTEQIKPNPQTHSRAVDLIIKPAIKEKS